MCIKCGNDIFCYCGQKTADVEVSLEGKHTKRSTQTEGGHQYIPVGQTIGGEVFPSVGEVKHNGLVAQ